MLTYGVKSGQCDKSPAPITPTFPSAYAHEVAGDYVEK